MRNILPIFQVNKEILYNEFEKRLQELRESVFKSSICVIDCETDENSLIGIGFYFPFLDKVFYLPLYNEEFLLNELKKLFDISDFFTKATLIFHGSNFDLKYLAKLEADIFELKFHDTMLMAYVLDSNRVKGLSGGLKLDSLCKYYGVQGKLKEFKEVDIFNLEDISKYCKQDCISTWQLFEKLKEEFKGKDRLKKIYLLEKSLVPILVQMEVNGIRLDLDKFEVFGKKVSEEIKKAEKRLFEMIGTQINLKSPKQVLSILPPEVRQNLPAGKTQPSAQNKYLKSFSHIPLIDALLQVRHLNSLYDTFYKGLKEKLIKGELYTNYFYTRSGRFCSSSPNLQNIPTEGELGGLLRDCFIPKEGYKFIVVDFSQIELVCLAAVTKDETLLKVFNQENADLHTETQKRLGISRKLAKTVNFGIAYGQTPAGLAQSQKMKLEEAEKLINSFYQAYPKVLLTKQKVERQLKNSGFVETYFGRRRYYNPPYNSSLFRSAFNFLCQGTAQDIFKFALLKLCKSSRNLRPVLQVHDEIVFEVPEEAISFEVKRIEQTLKNLQFELNFPVRIKATIGVGDSWFKAKK